jgi:hypothetical protein
MGFRHLDLGFKICRCDERRAVSTRRRSEVRDHFEPQLFSFQPEHAAQETPGNDQAEHCELASS